LRGEVDAGVAIVGGGLTGCACALSFAAAGIKVVLLEAEAIGQGNTAGESGLVRQDFDASFRDTSALHGLAAARTMWQAFRRASLDFSAALRRLNIRCGLAPVDLLDFVSSAPDTATALQREYRTRRAAGLDHSWVTPSALARETALTAGGAIRTRAAALDPYRAAIGLAAAAVSRGAALHERTVVKRIRARRSHVEVTTDAGVVRAEAVVVSTPPSLPDLKALRRHLQTHRSYVVVTDPLPRSMRQAVGSRTSALRQGGSPPHVLRWLDEDRVMFSGADQKELPARLRERALVQRSGQLMYELSLLYPEISGLAARWSWDVGREDTPDHLPFAGVHRSFPRHLFAFGGARHGAASAWLAARVLLRAFQQAPAKGDELFGFARIL
jgi:glycine/D-amino acid oxidase-like deaminating enzyme